MRPALPQIEKGPAALARLAATGRRDSLARLLPAQDAAVLRRTLHDLNRVSSAAARQMADDLQRALRRPRGRIPAGQSGLSPDRLR